MPPITEKIQKFFAAYPERVFSKKDILVQAGSDPQGVFYMTEGRVIQYDITATGNTVVVNSFKPGAFFPMSWAINKTPNNYFFEAAENTKAHIAPGDDVVAFLKDNPDVLFDLMARVYKGTDGVLRRMAHLMGGSAKSRVLYELINAVARFGRETKINETDLAKYTGLARESISREIKTLKENGALKVTRGGIVVEDQAKLEALLGNDL